jgi:hypothetical protein
MENNNKLTKLRKHLNLKENKEMLLRQMLSNTKRSSTLRTKKSKTATKPRMKPEKLTTKPCSNLIYKTIRSDGSEVSETKRKL